MRFLNFFVRRAPLPAGPTFYNTLSKEKEVFTMHPGAKTVRMYNCGPTVYDRQHIGNLSMFVFADLLRRTLEYHGMPVKQVINFTDFGHLAGDNEGNADEGEDRMTKGLKREGLELTLENMKQLGKKYAELFLTDIRQLNIDTARIIFPYASEYVPAQIAMVKALEEKGYAYATKDGVYFDTSRFPSYGKLGDIDLEGLRAGARVAASEEKRNPTDFLLWKSDPARGWDSPWGTGFPGWHIECSAMIRATLGEQIDIHTGGIEHIPIHHNNEIAQSEAATGKKPFARFWLHRAHIQLEGGKIAKSQGRVVYLSDIVERGYHPLTLRYLFLGAHYRTAMNFTWDALDAAATAFLRLHKIVSEAPEGGTVPESYRAKFLARIDDDLDTAGALAVLWEMTKDSALSPADLRAGLIDADRILGLSLGKPDEVLRAQLAKRFGAAVEHGEVPEDVQALLDERETARKEKNWVRADEIRDELDRRGFIVKDSATGVQLLRK